MNLEKTIQNLNKNGIFTAVAETKEDVIKIFKSMAPKGSVVGNGGSVSVEQCGLIDFVKNGDYDFVGRNVDENTDYFLCSSNAVTENGEIYNVDGFCNRISNIAQGPKNVVMVVGTNKIVADLNQAIYRVKTVAAPKNCVRLNKDTPCAKAGRCISLLKENPFMTDGCDSSDRICCSYLTTSVQRVKDRIKVIFVKEELGF
ncbi:MAG: lactate utilization protein [Clostridia bacterium]|nr:lactate utilization protein [Clostridia bacterium]